MTAARALLLTAALAGACGAAPPRPESLAGRAPAGAGAGTLAVGTLAGCRIFPADNPWNEDVSRAAVHPMSGIYIGNMNPTQRLHPDFGALSDGYGIPFASGTGAPSQPMTWTSPWGQRESDERPCPDGAPAFCYPIPLTAPIEGGPRADEDGDRHVLFVDTAGGPADCTLYELYQARNPQGSAGWSAANGAIFHLGSNALRPDGRTSADAAGLPILPGLVRLAEVQAGEIRHAIRFTVRRTSAGFIHPATHQAGSQNPALPPMGLRVRLKAGFDTGRFAGPSLMILTAMKRYGLLLADNGSDWYFTGDSDDGWKPYMEALVADFARVRGADFEVVDTGPVRGD